MINQNFKVTFAIREDIYFQFKDICLKENRKPATVIREFIIDYVKEKEKEQKRTIKKLKKMSCKEKKHVLT